MNTKQVIILRKDLGMRKGKMIAQGAHASMAVPLDLGGMEEIEDKKYFVFEMTPEVEDWIMGKFTKICVGVDSEDELLELYTKAAESGIVCSLINDQGLTEFHGKPTLTAVAIGPAEASKIDLLTGHLKLL